MPDDVKVLYIKNIREKFNTPDIRIADMLEIGRQRFIKEIGRLGLAKGKKAGGRKPWDEKGFNAWAYGEATPEEIPVEGKNTIPVYEAPAESDEWLKILDEPDEEIIPEPVEKCEKVATKPIPTTGVLDFTCEAQAALETVAEILGNKVVQISISWKEV